MGSTGCDGTWPPHAPAGQPVLEGRVARAPRGPDLVVSQSLAEEVCARRARGEGSADIGHDHDLNPLQILDIAAGRATVIPAPPAP
jgi:hypothetical protein